MGHLGFSYTGLIFLLLLFIPNTLWAKNKPAGYNPTAEHKLLLFLERLGQVLVTCTVLIFSDFNLKPFSSWSFWLVLACLLMLIYELYWLRYFKNPTLHNFYRPFLYIPAPGASLPVAAFLLLGIYGQVIWLIVSIIILGIGHIGIHLQHLNQLKSGQKP